MAVSSQFIRKSRRAAVLVYALVFTIVAAVVLYVAATVWQARQRADSFKDYAYQAWLIDWDIKHIIRAAYQTSLDSGYGLSAGNNWAVGWLTFSSSVSPSSYSQLAAGADPSGYASADYGSLYSNGPFASSSVNDYVWYLNFPPVTMTSIGLLATGSAVSNPDSYAAGASRPPFGPSDIFNLPGYRTRDTNNNDATPSDPTSGSGGNTLPSPMNAQEKNFYFVGFNTLSNTNYLFNRSDLPFVVQSTPGGGALSNWGLFRWVREGMQYQLQTKTSDSNFPVPTPGQQVMPQPLNMTQEYYTNYIWSVEEPITNYQLLLVDPSNATLANGWALSGSSGGIALGPSGGNLARMLVWGNLSAYFSSGSANIMPITGTASGSQLPIAALVGQSAVGAASLAANSAAEANFNWCVARPSTRISFGRGILSTTPSGLSNPNLPASYTFSPAPTLKDFLAAPYDDQWVLGGVSGGTNTDFAIERQLNLINSQGTPMPPKLYGSGITMSKADYVNPVLSLTVHGYLQWSAQGATSSIMGTPKNLTYQVAMGSANDNWWGDDKTNPAEIPASPATANAGAVALNTNGIPSYVYGISGQDSYNHASGSNVNVTVVNIDLSLFSTSEMASVNGTATASPWSAPREIYIGGPDNVGGATTPISQLVVRIIGDSHDTGAGMLPPVKIVVDGSRSSSCDVRLVPDSSALATAGIANYRRFILEISANSIVTPTTVSFAQDSFNGLTGSGSAWYGVILAPYGLILGSYSAETFTGGASSGNSPLAAGILWHGTILAGQSIALGGGPLTLTLAPDDGGGTATQLPTDVSSTYMLFLPWYDQFVQIPGSGTAPSPNTVNMGRPVPLLVPRMVWNFENATSHQTYPLN